MTVNVQPTENEVQIVIVMTCGNGQPKPAGPCLTRPTISHS